MKTCRRCGEASGWVLPSVLLAIMPKCPACVAAYVALATGVGLSFSAAAALRWAALAASVALLTFLTIRRVRVFVRR